MISRMRMQFLREMIEKASVSLNDNDALKAVEFFPNWSEDADYTILDRVKYNGILYKCLQTHRSQATWNPVDAVSLWTKVLIPDPEVIPEWEQPDSTNPYMKGDKVTHIGKVWISEIDYNVYEPSVYGWKEENE